MKKEYQKWQNQQQSKTKPCGLCTNQNLRSTLIWIFFQTDRLLDQRSDWDLKSEIRELKDKNAERNYTPEFEETRGNSKDLLLQKNSTHTLIHKQGIFSSGKAVTF